MKPSRVVRGKPVALGQPEPARALDPPCPAGLAWPHPLLLLLRLLLRPCSLPLRFLFCLQTAPYRQQSRDKFASKAHWSSATGEPRCRSSVSCARPAQASPCLHSAHLLALLLRLLLRPGPVLLRFFLRLQSEDASWHALCTRRGAAACTAGGHAIHLHPAGCSNWMVPLHSPLIAEHKAALPLPTLSRALSSLPRPAGLAALAACFLAAALAAAASCSACCSASICASVCRGGPKHPSQSPVNTRCRSPRSRAGRPAVGSCRESSWNQQASSLETVRPRCCWQSTAPARRLALPLPRQTPGYSRAGAC